MSYTYLIYRFPNCNHIAERCQYIFAKFSKNVMSITECATDNIAQVVACRTTGTDDMPYIILLFLVFILAGSIR
jgi:hypothetical protein